MIGSDQGTYQGRQEQGGTGCDELVGRPEVLGLRRPAMGVMHGAA